MTASVKGSTARTPKVSGGILPALTACAFFNDIEEIGVRRSRRRRQNTPPGKDEIFRRHGIAIGPQSLSQFEGPGQSVGRCRPRNSHAGKRAGIGGVDHQSSQQIGGDIIFGFRLGLRWVETSRLRPITPIQRPRFGQVPAAALRVSQGDIAQARRSRRAAGQCQSPVESPALHLDSLLTLGTIAGKSLSGPSHFAAGMA